MVVYFRFGSTREKNSDFMASGDGAGYRPPDPTDARITDSAALEPVRGVSSLTFKVNIKISIRILL